MGGWYVFSGEGRGGGGALYQESNFDKLDENNNKLAMTDGPFISNARGLGGGAGYEWRLNHTPLRALTCF